MNKSFKFVAFLYLLLVFFNCAESDNFNSEIFCTNDNSSNIEESDLCNPKLMAYHFGLDYLSPTQKINALYNIGLDGMIMQIEDSNISELGTYFNSEKVINSEFHIYDIFTSLYLDDVSKCEKQIATIETIFKAIKCKETRLQVLFHGDKNNETSKSSIANIAAIAKKYDKELIIYPHEGLFIETAEEALNLIQEINLDNVFLSVHLCHELAAGNGARLNEVIYNVKPYIKSVSISGATLNEQFNTTLPSWYWAIKPMAFGTYDYSGFYNTLYQNDYKGPIAIHTWGIYENFNLTPQQHLPEAKVIIENLAHTICN